MCLGVSRIAFFVLAGVGSLQALNIQFDYGYDTTSFFSGPNVARRAVLEAAAKVFENQFTNTSLAAVVPSGSNHWTLSMEDPATGRSVSLADKSIQSDTVTIYIGARDLPGSTIGLATTGYGASGSQAWLNQFDAKDTTSHYEPLGGSISFDSKLNWYFDLNTATTEDFTGKFDFFSVAQHEIAHILGFNSGSDAFAFNTDKGTGTFVGRSAKALYGGTAIPLAPDLSHLRTGLTYYGQLLTMSPALSPNQRLNLSPLEFAILKDIGLGGEVADPGQLSVQVNNADWGSVTEEFAGVTQLVVGEKYRITATPRAGYRFINWTGDINSGVNPLSFTMTDSVALRANFAPISGGGGGGGFISRAGSYYGTFADGSSSSTYGSWRLKVTVTSSFSGSLVLGNGRTVTVKGKVDQNGHFSGVFPNGAEWINFSFDQDIETGAISGELMNDGDVATFSGTRLPTFSTRNDGNQCLITGVYTLLILPEEGSAFSSKPQGTGFATITVDARGNVLLGGRLANDTSFSGSLPISDTYQADVSLILFSGLETLGGSLVFDLGNSTDDVQGSFVWKRNAIPEKPKQLFQEGFSAIVSATGSRWIKPMSGARVLESLDENTGLCSLLFTLDDKEVATGIVQVNAANQVVEQPVSPRKLKVSVSAFNGLFQGTFVDTTVKPVAVRNFTGALHQKQGIGEGYVVFKKKAENPRSGQVTLTPVALP